MGLLQRVEAMATRTRQAWPLGGAVATIGDEAWGHAQDTYAPPEYGDYVATSNGVYACATLRARLLSSLPLLPYRLRPRKGKEAVSGGPLVDLLTKVNPHWTMARLLQQTELSLCQWGQAHWFLERGQGGKQTPREIWWGRPDRTRVVTDDTDYIRGYLYYPLNASTPIAFDASEVIWFRYPNPLDEYSGLSPMAAARLAADYSTSATRANKNLFDHGLHMGGVISLADKQQVMTKDQRDEIETLIDRRFRGGENAHRWMVLRAALDIQGLSITPKDADYLGGLKQSLEDICRAFGVPQDLIGGQRTYENVGAAMRAIWTQTMRPEAALIAGELTEQLLPMFPAGSGDVLEFDFSEVEDLKEEETEAWQRWQQQIAAGAVTINEWRADQGLERVEWGDVYWASSSLKPVIDGEPPPPPPAPVIVAPGEKPTDQLPAGEEPKQLGDGQEPGAQPQDEGAAEEVAAAAPRSRGVAYGSDEHRALWQRFVTRTDAQEGKVATVVAALFRRQEASIIAKLGKRGQRGADPWEVPFDKARWKREFRVALRPVLRDIAAEAGQQGIASIGLGLAFDVVNPQVLRFIEQRAQRFATEVNETTWNDLRTSLSAGIEAGEDMDMLAKRVERVMGDRIQSSKDVIARTETIGAMNGGTLEGWRQAQDLVGPLNKHWVAALDDRTRDSHIAAHERYSGDQDGIPLEDDFQVGAGSGPGPGMIDLAEETCNCRCTLVAEPAPF
jgi:HK97 family phage portal protein